MIEAHRLKLIYESLFPHLLASVLQTCLPDSFHLTLSRTSQQSPCAGLRSPRSDAGSCVEALAVSCLHPQSSRMLCVHVLWSSEH